MLICLQIQFSSEMWREGFDGRLPFRRAMQDVLPALHARWKALGCRHHLTVLAFYRTKQESCEETHASALAAPDGLEENDDDSRDYYNVLYEGESPGDWGTLRDLLEAEFASLPSRVGWSPPVFGKGGVTQRDLGSSESGRSLTSASRGNALEALNLVLNRYHRHNVDRALSRTGLSILLVSPGSGVFFAHSRLARMTEARMVGDGVGCDLVCLSPPPLHRVPLIVLSGGKGSRQWEFRPVRWLHVSFPGSQKLMSSGQTGPTSVVRLPGIEDDPNGNTAQGQLEGGHTVLTPMPLPPLPPVQFQIPVVSGIRKVRWVRSVVLTSWTVHVIQ